MKKEDTACNKKREDVIERVISVLSVKFTMEATDI